jgi:hypothetical protein
MIMFEAYHEPGAKTLLNDFVIPDGQTGMQDIEAAVDNLFHHPNVGPFVGKQLIQRLVTSNPSPEYVSRVSAAFNGDSTGIRGDMKAVLKAIITDPEAANAVRVREPFRRYLAINRSLDVTSSDGSTYPGIGFVAQNLTGQFVLAAPSVFNFYSPFYRPGGEAPGLIAPELQITTEDTIVGITNLMALTLYTERSINTPEGLATISVDLSALASIANDSEALLDRIELLFFAGNMGTYTRQTIHQALSDAGAIAALDRTRLALYLAVISPDQAVTGAE